jgi:hypothetical protein
VKKSNPNETEVSAKKFKLIEREIISLKFFNQQEKKKKKNKK